MEADFAGNGYFDGGRVVDRIKLDWLHANAADA
jgi:hypothetical protein